MQLHPWKTPLGDDVDFAELAARFEVTGGDIRNAVLKAALAAAAEEGPDEGKRIHQHHFVRAMEDVLAGKRVMRQSIMDGSAGGGADAETGMVRSSDAREALAGGDVARALETLMRQVGQVQLAAVVAGVVALVALVLALV